MEHIQLAIVDDQSLFRKGLRLILENCISIEIIIEAENGNDLIHQLQYRQPDIVLMDLKMPKLDGIQTTEIIKKEYPRIKILILSLYDDERIISHIMRMGANGYLLKTEDPDTVLEAIKTVYNNDYYFGDYVSRALLKNLPKIEKTLEAQLKTKNQIHLTKRENEILKLICQELTTPEIAEKLFISKRTVEGHRKNLLEKTGVKNTAGLVLFALRNKVFEL